MIYIGKHREKTKSIKWTKTKYCCKTWGISLWIFT